MYTRNGNGKVILKVHRRFSNLAQQCVGKSEFTKEMVIYFVMKIQIIYKVFIICFN